MQTHDSKAFVSYATSKATSSELAQQQGVSRRTLDRRFKPFWLIDIPNDGDPQRVYGQIFIDPPLTPATRRSQTHILTLNPPLTPV